MKKLYTKNKFFHFRLTESERKILFEKADKAGMSASEFVRALIRSAKSKFR